MGPARPVSDFTASWSSKIRAGASTTTTTGEAGFPDLVVTSWQAVAAPAKTPREVVARLNDASVRALRSPDIRERMTQIGFDVVASTPEEFGKFMNDEVARWTTVVQKGGIKAE